MGVERVPDEDRKRVKGGHVPASRVVAIITLLAIAAVGLSSRAPSGLKAGARPPQPLQPPRGPGPIRLNVRPATLELGRANPISIASPDLVAGAAEPDLVLTIPELDWTRRVKPEELRRGLSVEIRPDTLGIFRIRVLSNSSVRVGSPSPLTIKAGTRIADCRLSSSGSVEDATITFSEPIYAMSCTVRVRFTIPWPYYALAFVCAGFAVLVARRQDLSAMSWWEAGVEVLFGGVGAVALYMAILSGWFRSMTGARLGLDVTTALLIGLAGGLLGLTLFDLVIGAIRTISEARALSEGQAPSAPDGP
jgi:hypothetical protein